MLLTWHAVIILIRSGVRQGFDGAIHFKNYLTGGDEYKKSCKTFKPGITME